MNEKSRRIALGIVLALSAQTAVWAQKPVSQVSRALNVTRSGSAGPVPAAVISAPSPGRSTAPVNKLWAFRPPVRTLPPVPHHAAGSNPIDAFIRARLESAGIAPSAAADRNTLIRRVTFDLTGLPPTPAEIAAFTSDRSSDAYEKVVDRLLAAPQYGERWGRHWLDLVRYADSEGFKSDEMRPTAWRYRDYVVSSFNADKPYDRFLREQLAGDEAFPTEPDARIATAFCRHWADESNVRDVMLRRQEILNDITDVTGATMLGLTVGCARCHDHKYDPVSQKDYYRLQAFFAAVWPRDDVSTLPDAEERARLNKLRDWDAKTAAVRAALSQLEKPYHDQAQVEKCHKFPDDVKEAAATAPEKRTPLQWVLYRKAESQIGVTETDIEAAMKSAPAEVKTRHAELLAKLAQFDKLKPAAPPLALGITDIGPTAPPTYRLLGGVYDKYAEQVEPGFLSAISGAPAQIATLPQSTGRRTALANWIASGDNPLTARVMVNRLWQHHFGRGIVATSSDFGAAGERPTHPELLDWLATEFVKRAWSVKQIQRLIVTSATYRQAADFRADAARTDPDNRLMWRFNRQRLEGESIRDAMLCASGELSPTVGGPAVMAELPAAVTTRGYWKSPTDPAQLNRRSLYVFVKRNLRYPLFDAFDFPDTHEPCARRQVTTTAPQALLLLNDETTVKLARSFAARVVREVGSDRRKQVERAYLLAFGRLPAYDETKSGVAFMERQSALAADVAKPLKHVPASTAGLPDNTKAKTGQTVAVAPVAKSPPIDPALVDFCHALFNANEFCHVE